MKGRASLLRPVTHPPSGFWRLMSLHADAELVAHWLSNAGSLMFSSLSALHREEVGRKRLTVCSLHSYG